MRVCQVIDRLNGGGQERAAVEFAIGLRDFVETSTLLATRCGGDYEGLLREAHIDYLAVERASRYQLRPWIRAFGWLRRRDFDIIHTHSPGSLLNLLLMRRLTGLRFRVVAHLQMLPGAGTAWRRKVVAWHTWTRREVDLTIVTNDGLREFLIEKCHHSPERVVTLFNPVDFGRYSSYARYPEAEIPIVTMVAQWRRQKDHATAIRAARILKDRGAKVRFRFVGELDPELSRPAELLAKNLAVSIEILGRRTDVPSLLAESDVGILATHYEGLPVALVEYAASALPIVVSDVEGTSNLIEPEMGIIGVPHEDPTALADEIQRLLSDRKRARALGASARQKLLPLADTRAVMARTIAWYESISPGGD